MCVIFPATIFPSGRPNLTNLEFLNISSKFSSSVLPVALEYGLMLKFLERRMDLQLHRKYKKLDAFLQKPHEAAMFYNCEAT